MPFDLSRLGWDDFFAAAFRPYDRSDALAGRVLRADRGVCTIAATHGVTRATLGGGALLAAATDAARLPCPGDWVVLRRWPDRRVTIECVLPRRTTLRGRTPGAVLAANLDTVAMVEPIRPEPGGARIERLIALASDSGTQPLLVLSKADTVPDPGATAGRLARLVPVVAVSARGEPGVEQLRAYVPDGHTLALLGRSGAGKSALVDALAGAPVLPVQPDRTGRHTTTCDSLVPLPSGGVVLDTAGSREGGLLDTGAGRRRARTS